MVKLKVAVSPFYAKEVFHDEVSGIKFEKSKNAGLYPYEISKDTKLDGIRRAIRLNVLMLLEGQLPEEEIKQPVAQPVEVPEVQESEEEPEAEIEVQEVKQQPKPKAQSKKK